MKKITKIFSIFALLFVLVFALTSCGENKKSDENTFEVCQCENIKTDGLCEHVEEVNGKKVICNKTEEEHSDEFKDDNADTICDDCGNIEENHTKHQFIDCICKFCGVESAKHDEKITEFIFTSEHVNNLLASQYDKAEKEYKAVDYLGLFNAKTGTLYLEGALVPEYELDEEGKPTNVKIKYQLIEKDGGLPALNIDGKGFFGPYFAGWYGDAELRDGGSRLVTFDDLTRDEDHIVYGYYINFVQAILVALVCIVIVFSMLALLWGLVSLLRFFVPKQKEQPKAVEAVKPASAPVKKAISLEDIKDEEMMAAALVATIDYHEETQEDVRVVSIKEIK